MEYFPKMTPKIKETLGVEHQKGMIKNSVEWFSREMQGELLKHLDRPGWKRESIEYLMSRLKEELIELEIELKKSSTIHDSADYYKREKQVIKECADIANFAMMIADNIK